MHPDPINSFLLELLVENQWLTSIQAQEIGGSVDASLSGEPLEVALYQIVLDTLAVDETSLLELIADAEGIQYEVSPTLPTESHADLRGFLEFEAAQKYGVVPMSLSNEGITLATSYPCHYGELDTLAHMMDREVEVALVTSDTLKHLYHSLYAESMDAESTSLNEDSVSEIKDSSLENWMQSVTESSFVPGNGVLEEGDVSRYVDWAIEEAIKRRASDIHFEPMEYRFRIRCRVDGMLQQLDSPSKKLQNSILSRLKLMAHIDIAEKRLPQDGRFHLELNRKSYDFRVSTVPSTHGEGIVVRILDKERLNIGLPELGMLDDHRERFESVITEPDGIFLVTGPTGSGKSTTLYAALNFINDPAVKILTVEDPVEYHIEGINQVQVRNEVDMTFSAALRSMLRQAPNIIMVGEIRDKETADIAINASLTGHTVFSTLHTNDAPSAITRLIDMGAKPFLVSAALRAVMAQRLVRKIPEKLRVPYDIADWQIQALGPDYDFLLGRQFYHAGESHQSFHGRIGLFEMFEVDEWLGEIIYKNASLSTIRQNLRQRGFQNMRIDGVQKALKGWTSIEEVLSVTPLDDPLLVPKG